MSVSSNADKSPGDKNDVPVIDLAAQVDASFLAEQVANACSSFGFFQVVNHNIPDELIADFRRQMELFFALPYDCKIRMKRDERNARGFFDDELTKRQRDWKEALDIGVPGSRNWTVPDDDERNACLDGFNRFPNHSDLPDFRDTVVRYFEACEILSDRLAGLMSRGIGLEIDYEKEKEKAKQSSHKTNQPDLISELRSAHTSYLRMNYYPPCPLDAQRGETPPLGISPHKDAGFLTVLVQDDDCHSLQVARHATDDVPFDDLEWVTVRPIPGALTINTGDMAMIWSNGRYKAPLHRVQTDPYKARYSAPFFYNPGYSMQMRPILKQGEVAEYEPCLWGYFRAVRFAGDLTDLGVEIQSSDFLCVGNKQKEQCRSTHVQKQYAFSRQANCLEPFSIKKYRPLLEDQVSETTKTF